MSIFYFCPVTHRPIGGIKQIFRHVDALVSGGHDAYVLFSSLHRPQWFSTDVNMATLPESFLDLLRRLLKRSKPALSWLGQSQAPKVRLLRAGARSQVRSLTPDDVIVIPEFYGRWLSTCGFGSKVVVFNQNAHYTFNHFTATETIPGFVYLHDPLTVLAVSSHIVAYLSHTFPKIRLSLIPNGVDAEVFKFSGNKKRQIAYMPRKLPKDLVQVLQILNHRGTLKGWTLRPIDGVPESEVASILGESAVYLSTCDAEGFGLPPLEAGACGCIVVGYTGYAAGEFMLPDLCHPIEQGNILAFATRLEAILKEYEVDPSPLLGKAKKHSAFILENYSIKVEREKVLEIWNNLLQPTSASVPTHGSD